MAKRKLLMGKKFILLRFINIMDEALELDEHRLPIAAVVEDENGTMEINGKRYQPIGLMNSSEDDATPGAVVMREIRKSASSLPLKKRRNSTYNK